MQVYLGPFHPTLEEALVREIRNAKEGDPFAPLLVLVPSAPIRNRIKILLAEEAGLTPFNLHLLTFHQLSRRLFEERFGETGLGPMDDLFFEEVLREVLRELPPADSPFIGLGETPGGCAALWQTLRDLKDGLVDGETVLAALEEGVIGGEESRRGGADLLRLYREVRNRCEALGVRDYTDLDLLAAEGVPDSGFLKGFRRIFYYGFYDLTQVQLDFFQAVVRACPVTLFFPLLEKDPAWEFSERFYRRYVRGMVADPADIHVGHRERSEAIPGVQGAEIASSPSAPRNDGPKISIIHCSGTRDEVLTAAKEIVRLREEEGIPFHAMGVTAREMGIYGPWIREIFPKHGIPVSGEARGSLVRFPLTQAVLLLLDLPGRDYRRSEVIDLLASPFFNPRPLIPGGVHPRPDLWDALSRKLGIARGIGDWARLRHRFDLVIPAVGEEREGEGISIAASEAEILHGIVSRLYERLEGLPQEGTWSEYTERCRTLLEEFLILGSESFSRPIRKKDADPHIVAEAIFRTLDALPSLDRIVSPISRDRFLQTFRNWLERGSVPLGDGEVAGVAVMDAMAGRGLSFRVLFLLGLNEGIFPRVIREDPFLKDDLRRGMETVLGCKVPEKLAGYDEERLLFALLTGAPRDRLYILHQRSDDAGRAAAPSGYLLEFRRTLMETTAQAKACGYPGSRRSPADSNVEVAAEPPGSQADSNVEVAAGFSLRVEVEERGIPRGILDKEPVPPFDDWGLLTPHEAAVRSILRRRDPTPLLKSFSLHPDLYRRGIRVLESIDRFQNVLMEHDGVTGPIPRFWETIRREGIPPTALQDYARCPFLFFARRLLSLRPLEFPEEMSEIDSPTLGELGHEILRRFHQTLVDRGSFSGRFERESVPAGLREAIARRVFSDHEAEHPVGYPVVWEIRSEELSETLSRVVDGDLEEMIRTGFLPASLEETRHARFPEEWPDPLGGLPLSGRLDRIDRDGAGRARVIDYKFTWRKTQPSEDKDLLHGAIRGDRLQPPVYLLLAASPGKGDSAVAEAAFYFAAPRWPDGPFTISTLSGEVWAGETGERIKETLALLVRGIRDGRFFILPGSQCGFCEVSSLCRKDHPPTRWRSDHDPGALPLRALRERKRGS